MEKEMCSTVAHTKILPAKASCDFIFVCFFPSGEYDGTLDGTNSFGGGLEVWRPFGRLGRVRSGSAGYFCCCFCRRNGTDSRRPSSLAGYFTVFRRRNSHVGLWDFAALLYCTQSAVGVWVGAGGGVFVFYGVRSGAVDYPCRRGNSTIISSLYFGLVRRLAPLRFPRLVWLGAEIRRGSMSVFGSGSVYCH